MDFRIWIIVSLLLVFLDYQELVQFNEERSSTPDTLWEWSCLWSCEGDVKCRCPPSEACDVKSVTWSVCCEACTDWLPACDVQFKNKHAINVSFVCSPCPHPECSLLSSLWNSSNNPGAANPLSQFCRRASRLKKQWPKSKKSGPLSLYFAKDR